MVRNPGMGGDGRIIPNITSQPVRSDGTGLNANEWGNVSLSFCLICKPAVLRVDFRSFRDNRERGGLKMKWRFRVMGVVVGSLFLISLTALGGFPTEACGAS